MLRRVAQLALPSALVACAACGGAALPPLGARARVVPKPLGAPTSCEGRQEQEQGQEQEPRALTDLERRMRDSLVLPNGEPDLEACRAVCRRALRPGDDVVSCFLVTSKSARARSVSGTSPTPWRARSSAENRAGALAPIRWRRRPGSPSSVAKARR